MDIVELWRIYWPDWTQQTILAGVVLVSIVCFPQLVRLMQKKIKWISFLSSGMLLTWLYWVYASCVLCRNSYEDYHYNLQLFWSYAFMKQYPHSYMLQEILMNMVMLLPVGVLFPIAFDCHKAWLVTLFGFLCSAGIELLQLVCKKGLFEWDDMIHNTIGVVAGFLLVRLAVFITEKQKDAARRKRIAASGLRKVEDDAA